MKIRCPGNPKQILAQAFRNEPRVDDYDICSNFFHPECARSGKHFNLSLDFKEIYCQKHRKQLRFEAIKQMNGTYFASNAGVKGLVAARKMFRKFEEEADDA